MRFWKLLACVAALAYTGAASQPVGLVSTTYQAGVAASGTERPAGMGLQSDIDSAAIRHPRHGHQKAVGAWSGPLLAPASSPHLEALRALCGGGNRGRYGSKSR